MEAALLTPDEFREMISGDDVAHVELAVSSDPRLEGILFGAVFRVVDGVLTDEYWFWDDVGRCWFPVEDGAC